MNVQEVFNKVIKAGLFVPTSFNMRWVVCKALKMGILTLEQRNLALSEIELYTFGCELTTMLNAHLLPRDYAAQLAIYSDWFNRPSLKRQPRKVF